METPVNSHSELMEDSLRNIEPVQLGVEQMCQARCVVCKVRAGSFHILLQAYTGTDLCEIGSGATSGVVAGQNPVAGLWDHQLNARFPVDDW